MRVLIACEESQEVCRAFREIGHEAYSRDIRDCSGGHPEWHIERDVLEVPDRDRDIVIAHPPCTDLAVSGARRFAEKRADGRQRRSMEFFMKFTECKCERVAIENPVGIMSTIWRKPDQIIQPWQFGCGETEKTCLWPKNLPKPVPTDIVEGRGHRIWKMPPSGDRAKLRSRTYPGIARAMAAQRGI